MNIKSRNDKILQYPILEEALRILKLRNVSENTIINYIDGIARFLDFINYDNHFEITEQMFDDYLTYLHSTPLKKNSINNYNSFVRFFFRAVLNRPINTLRLPMAKVARKEIDYLFDHQVLDLLAVSSDDSRIDCIIKLGLCCGLRINEVVSLKVSDIHTRDRNNMCVHVRESKRNKSRFVPLDRTTYRAIQRYAKEYRIRPGTDRYFFTFSDYGMTCNETIRRHFNRCALRAGLPDSITFHCLRHTYAVNFLRAGGDIHDLKYRLGHGSLQSTCHYLHVSRNMMNTNISYYDRLLRRVPHAN